MRLDDAVALGVERDGADGRPVPRGAGPARRVEFASPAIQGKSGGQNVEIVVGVALRRTDATNADVPMIDVLPMHEGGCPGARLAEFGKSLRGELGTILGGAKQRFGIRVVVADARPGITTA